MKYEETRVAIVTGAGSGIGLAIAQTLAKSGHAIVVVDINDRRAEDLAANLRHSGSSALAVHANLSQRDDPFGIVTTTLGHYGHVDVLVNNAGIMDGFAPLLDMDEALLSRVMGVNLEGALWASRAALRAMLERGCGVIVNIASIGGFAGGRAGTAYTVSKHALIGLTRSVAWQYGPQGVRFELHQPWSALLLDDEKVIHESTPIQPLNPALPSWRDTLVLTFRHGGFQGPQETA